VFVSVSFLSFRAAQSPSPESILPVSLLVAERSHRDYGFRARAKRRVPE
jgi:hypothetical protein